jgi:hypothetical protein
LRFLIALRVGSVNSSGDDVGRDEAGELGGSRRTEGAAEAQPALDVLVARPMTSDRRRAAK